MKIQQTLQHKMFVLIFKAEGLFTYKAEIFPRFQKTKDMLKGRLRARFCTN